MVKGRFFNTAGPCRAHEHYMVPPERRLPGVRELIGQGLYFVVHAPRQVGKTTCLRTLAEVLTAEGEVAALHASCETGQVARDDVEKGVSAVLYAIGREAQYQLPEELRPPPVDEVSGVPPQSRLAEFLSRWSERCPRPVVLFLDEIDALMDDSLVSVLRQLREGYVRRPASFPSSLALIGLRDVRDYKGRLRPDAVSLGTASPFNIKVESITIRDFVAEEVVELLEQHAQETGQAFSAEAQAQVFEQTQGQPWMVNALARQCIEVLVPQRDRTIEVADVERAREILIQRRDTHLDSLIDKLREPRVRRVIEPILAGELLLGDRINDDMAYTEDLGLIKRQGRHVRIANPIYHEVIPRALASITQHTIPHETEWYVDAEGKLDMRGLLEGFVEFWKEHGEALLAHQPYPEVAPHLVLMAFLQRVVNGGGFIDREYAVGSGRLDLCVRWPWSGGVQLEALELKARRKERNPLSKGLDQLAAYLDRLGLERGVLVIFDQRPDAPELTERVAFEEEEHEGKAITILWL